MSDLGTTTGPPPSEPLAPPKGPAALPHEPVPHELVPPSEPAALLPPTRPGAAQVDLREEVNYLNEWVLSELPRLNRAILDRHVSADALATAVGAQVMPHLPDLVGLPMWASTRLVVLLGMIGASVARHYQEADQEHRATPERAFAGLYAGGAKTPFRSYFADLAHRTGTGHCGRDTYASLTRWNLPTVEVWWGSERLAALGSAFDDGQVRTYTGYPDERRFFELIKLSEALERAANDLLLPLAHERECLADPAATRQVVRATFMINELRSLNVEFAARADEDGLRVEYFMDVFRQYAVHWSAGDVPPSGALDPEGIARDRLLGTGNDAYERHARRLWPALLDDERAMLSRLAQRPCLPDQALELAGLNRESLAHLDARALREVVLERPLLAALYLLLTAHARMSGVHLKITKKYLFAPQREREQSGLGDPGVVSNRTGTTGMNEGYLDELTRARHHHALAPLRACGAEFLSEITATAEIGAQVPGGYLDLLRYGGDPRFERPSRVSVDHLPIHTRPS